MSDSHNTPPLAADDPELLAKLQDSSVQVRQAAAQALAQVPGAGPHLAALRAALTNCAVPPIDSVHRLAHISEHHATLLAALATAGAGAAALPWLFAYLDNPAAGLQDSAAQVLKTLVAQPAIRTALLTRLQAAEITVRLRVVEALAEAAFDPTVRMALLTCLPDTNVGLRGTAAQALAGVVVDPVVQTALLTYLADKEEFVRRSAARALAGAVHNPTVRDALLACLEDKNDLVRAAAASALGGAAPDPMVRAALLTCLKNPSVVAPCAAARALAGVVADPTVQAALLTRLKDMGDFVWQDAVAALAKAVFDPTVRAALLVSLEDEYADMRAATARALAGAVHDPTVQAALLTRLADDEYAVRQAAAEALAGAVYDSTVQAALFTHLEFEWRAAQQAVAVLTNNTFERYLSHAQQHERDIVLAAVFRALGPLAQTHREVAAALERGLTTGSIMAQVTARAVLLPNAPEVLAHAWRDWLLVDKQFLSGGAAAEVEAFRRALAARLGPVLPYNPDLLDWVLACLRSPRASARLGGALALLHWPGGPPPEQLQAVLATLDDNRDLISYPARLAAARALLNRDPAEEYNDPAVRVALETLDYGTQPWEDILESREIRQEAALLLGQLDPLRYTSLTAQVHTRLQRVLAEDPTPEVRAAALGALERLAGVREVSDY